MSRHRQAHWVPATAPDICQTRLTKGSFASRDQILSAPHQFGLEIQQVLYLPLELSVGGDRGAGLPLLLFGVSQKLWTVRVCGGLDAVREAAGDEEAVYSAAAVRLNSTYRGEDDYEAVVELDARAPMTRIPEG